MLATPVELEGKRVRLVPLSQDHTLPLLQEAQDPHIWEWWSKTPPTDERTLRRSIDDLLAERNRGTALPFTIEYVPEGHRLVGMTRFMEIRREHRRVEIGGSWLPARLWGTGVNVEAKYLLLRHAFEQEGVERVELKTDVRNLRSQKAMEKIGAVREGVLRHHMRLPDGTYRDSVYYSILLPEWTEVRGRLERLLSAPSPSLRPVRTT